MTRTPNETERRLFLMAPIDADGYCTGCNHKPTRETGRCLCIGGVATRYLPSQPPSLDVKRLTTVLYDWMPDGADVSIDFDGHTLHLTGADLARFIFDRAAEYER